MAERLTVQIDTENAAFDDAPATELARILRELAQRLESVGVLDDAALYDLNGNRCGLVTIKHIRT